MNKLRAVNRIFNKCGIGSVSALDTGGASLASEAERLIDSVAMEVQAEGWHFNIRTNVEVEPDGSDNIVVPSGTIAMDTDAASIHIDTAQVGDKLYNKDDNTDEFASSVYTEQTLAYSFGCIPFAIKNYIVARAAVEFARVFKNMEPRLIRQLEGDMLKAKVEANRYEVQQSDINMLQTEESLAAVGKRRGYYDRRRRP